MITDWIFRTSLASHSCPHHLFHPRSGTCARRFVYSRSHPQTYLNTLSNCPESIDHIYLCMIQNRLANHLDGGVDAVGCGEDFSAEFIG
jgi:hypothetical protein